MQVEGGAEVEGKEGGFQADSVLSAELNARLDPRTLRSLPELNQDSDA